MNQLKIHRGFKIDQVSKKCGFDAITVSVTVTEIENN